MAGDDFLSRWSRRKREVVEAEAPQPPAEAAPGQDTELQTDAAGDAALDTDALTDEAVAALPSLDAFTVETDLTQFLQAGVPQVLRNAALRRMWSIDPSIRDYLSEAREYAFDWHIPGAVPGTGPMLPTDDIAGMVREIFAGSKPLTEESAQIDLASESAPGGTELPVETGPVETPVIAAIDSAPAIDSGDERSMAPRFAAEQVETILETPAGGRLRRHGGASPI